LVAVALWAGNLAGALVRLSAAADKTPKPTAAPMSGIIFV
jgi:hypothetical protein